MLTAAKLLFRRITQMELAWAGTIFAFFTPKAKAYTLVSDYETDTFMVLAEGHAYFPVCAC